MNPLKQEDNFLNKELGYSDDPRDLTNKSSDGSKNDSGKLFSKFNFYKFYKIYKSTDGGLTWGDSEDKIYNLDGVHEGWQPMAQFDLSAEEDSLFCVKGLDLSPGGVFNDYN